MIEYDEPTQSEDGKDNFQSYHTLNRKLTEEESVRLPLNEDSLFEPAAFNTGVGPLKKNDLPNKFQQSTLTGFKSKLGENSTAPSCFCEK